MRRAHLAIAITTYLFAVVLSYQAFIALNLSDNFSFSKDQLWSIPEAITFLHNISLNDRNEIILFNWHVPIATGPYGGAFKTYSYSAAFALLNFSAEKIILCTNLFLTAIFLLALVYGVKEKSLPNLFPILLIPLLDLHFLFGSILDAGPILIEIIFLTLTIIFLSKLVSGESSDLQIRKFLLLSLCCCGFAINDKITILPNLIAPFIAVILMNGAKVYKSISSFKFQALALLVVALATQPFFYFLLREGIEPMFSMVGDSFAIKTSFLQRMRDLSLNFFELSNSTYFFDIMSGENPQNNFSYTKVLLTISIVGSVPFVISKIRKKSERGDLFLFLAITSCISFLLQSSVQGLNRPWHIFQLYPPLILLSAESLRSLRKIKLVSPLVYIATFGLLTIQAQNIISILDRVKNTNGINEFSPNIRECANTLVENGISDLYILNYSVGEPLYVYSKGQIAFHDLYWGEKKHILDQLKNNHIIQRIAFRRPVQTKSTFGTQLEFLKGPLDEAEKLEFFEVEFQCIDKGGSAITIARRKK